MTDSIFTPRRAFLACATATLALGLAAGAAQAADKFPSKTIEVVTHAGAGGGTDVTTRMMMMRARRELKADMTVVSKRGGGGAVAMNYINGKDRDGHTIMTITPSHLFTIAMGKSVLKIDDLVGIARATDDPQLLMAKAGKFKDAKAMLAEAGKRKLKVAGTHVGGIDQVTVATFANKAGIKINYIPYEGGGHIVTNLIGGDVDIGVLNLSEAESQIKAGEIQPLIVLAKKRMGPLPDVPTSVEMGIDATFSTVRGFVTLKGTGDAELKTLETKIVKAMKHSYYLGYLETVGLDAGSIVGSADWTAQIKQLYADGEKSLKELGFIK
ncbi:MAG: tripartite tricarboxylate transporter substrate binding protein [Rhodospirillales bacterium]|nr:tripartite tricarboxylate transporter substrate binding protein [Rhodospirillales bacterium]